MIEINLLPEALRKKQEPAAQKIPLNLILFSVGGVILAVFLITGAISVAKIITLRALEVRLKALTSEQAKLTAIERKKSSLKSENTMYLQFTTRNFLWSKLLNKISDLVVPGVWLQNLSLEKELPSAIMVPRAGVQGAVLAQFIMINGTAVSLERDEMPIISEFIRNLKSDKEFFGYFKNIELEGVLRRNIASVEAMDFTLKCYLKEDVNL